MCALLVVVATVAASTPAQAWSGSFVDDGDAHETAVEGIARARPAAAVGR